MWQDKHPGGVARWRRPNRVSHHAHDRDSERESSRGMLPASLDKTTAFVPFEMNDRWLRPLPPGLREDPQSLIFCRCHCQYQY